MIENSAVRTPALTNSAARTPALICVLTPVLIATSAGLIAIAGWAILWLLLGAALFTTARVPATR